VSAGFTLPTFELHKVCKRFGAVTVLDHVSLEFGAGQRHALLGPNGSGKTTLLRVMAGRIAVDSGEARCCGMNLRTSATRLRPEVRYLTQHFSHYGELTVRENMEFAASMHGISDGANAVELALNDFDLLANQTQRAQTLSGGTRQRLMLATVLLGEPKILLLDEPTAALDSNARRSFWRLMDRRRTPAITLIMTTHLQEDVERCNTVTRLREGRIERHSGRGGRVVSSDFTGGTP
jgi:ABC-2 type transport system ATP-binding protein